MKLYLVRHAQSQNNANPNGPTHDDAPLTGLGHEQARLTGAYLASLELKPAMLYASPMMRALQTVSHIQRELAMSPRIIPDICECGGPHRPPGRSSHDILKEFPNVDLDERVGPEGWWTSNESDDDDEAIYSRAIVVGEWLRTRRAHDRRVVIAVSHGRFGSALVSSLLGLGPAGYSRFPFDNCGITRIDFDPHGDFVYAPSSVRAADVRAVRLRFHNATAHLPVTHVT